VSGNRPARRDESGMPEPPADEGPVVPGYDAELDGRFEEEG
jgi:hypothetical protein